MTADGGVSRPGFRWKAALSAVLLEANRFRRSPKQVRPADANVKTLIEKAVDMQMQDEERLLRSLTTAKGGLGWLLRRLLSGLESDPR